MKTVYQTVIAVLTAALGGDIALLSSANEFYDAVWLKISAIGFFASIIGSYLLMLNAATKEARKSGLSYDDINEMHGYNNSLNILNRWISDKIFFIHVIPFYFYICGFFVGVFGFVFSLKV